MIKAAIVQAIMLHRHQTKAIKLHQLQEGPIKGSRASTPW
jgi:hypothetical protein